MRSRLVLVAACFVVVAGRPAFARETAEKPAKPAPPEKIAGKTLEQWTREMTYPDPGVRETAVKAVPYFGEPALAAVPTLVKVLDNDPDIACNVYAALSLSILGPHVKDDAAAANAVRSLIDKAEYGRGQAILRLHALLALGSFGNKALPAIPILIKRIHDPNSWELRQAALSSLASVAGDKKNGPDPQAAAAVAKLLNPPEKSAIEKSSRVRLAAVQCIRDLGRPQGNEYDLVHKALEKATSDPDKTVAIWALVAKMELEDKFLDQQISELTNHLKGKDVSAKITAAAALAALPKDKAASSIPTIIEMLEDKDLMAQAAAIEALTSFGKAANDAVPALRRIMELKGQNNYIMLAAQAAIKQITGTEPKLPENTTGTGSTSTQSKAPELKELAGKTLDEWIKEIRNPDPSVQQTAIQAVPYFGEKARAARKALVERLKTDHVDLACRAHALLALAAIADYLSGVDATEAVDAITRVVRDDGQAILRYHAAVALGAFGTRATSAIPDLVNRIADPNSWELRQAVVASLSGIAAGDSKTPPDGRAVRAVAGRLVGDGDKSAQVRVLAAMALGGMGRPVDRLDFDLAVKGLFKGMQDSDKSVAIWSVVALMAVDKVTDKGLDKVAEHLKGKDVMEKVTSARALGAMAKEAKPKVGDIANLLDDKDPLVIATALDVLGELGTTARDAVPRIEKFSARLEKDKEPKNKDQNDYFIKAARYTIDKIKGERK
jgi:HEAT repeat protein